MRPRTAFTGAALTAALGLLALPTAVGSMTSEPAVSPEGVAFQAVLLDSRQSPTIDSVGSLDDDLRSAGAIDPSATFREPGVVPIDPTGRTQPVQPGPRGGFDWQPARYTLTGTATFYDAGMTAMRLPRGTIILVCGAGGCLERVVNDYGPTAPDRIIDLHRPDFFKICACPDWSGTTTVTVHVY
jgi:hypothetical protein